jgi:prolipoprotein diacylglyceryltransferase
MKLSRVEANWIASKLLADAEREREQSAQRRTAPLVALFPTLAAIRSTERISVLRNARQRAAREPLILWSTIVAALLFVVLYFALAARQHPWLYWLPSTIIIGFFFAQYLRTRAILRDCRTPTPNPTPQ